MLYKKNTTPALKEELFRNPTSEYRGTPFWAWNCALEDEELCRQIEVFRQMGFGGFHMHVRTGLVTPYLSDEYMGHIKACVEKAREEKMLAWLYDEDRWPSGAAGGIVTKDEQYRARFLVFTPTRREEGKRTDSYGENFRLLATFDVVLSPDGFLESYREISPEEAAKGRKWYAYLQIDDPSPWHNNQTYVNTLDKKAIARFVEVTHERYKESVGADFGGVIPAIFTDEPQFSRKEVMQNSLEPCEVELAWTDDLEETYRASYGDTLTDKIPELFWEQRGKVSLTRYRYHDHVAERFAEAFADTVGSWCRKNGIALTGHMMEEPTLRSQTAALGEAMRSYRGFDLPGIDMLCAAFELNTAKQAQSACHQYNREGILSELYGVTGWSFDFRGHKLHGDWQAALGVTVRVPHLSWASMAGAAKRDYPASISYQSPWYTEYSAVEDHFARVNTCLTRGKPVVKVGVIHPVESFWLHWGPNDKTALYREQLDSNFSNLTDWLLKGSIDFDFISESLLPSLCPEASAPLQVGAMAYDAVIVPACETLRPSTLSRLEAFHAAKGKLIFMGSAPTLEGAVPSKRGEALADKAIRIPFARADILTVLEEQRTVDLRTENGRLTDNYVHTLRQDGESLWLFLARAAEPYNKDVSTSDSLRIAVKGEYAAELYDTESGEILPVASEIENGFTVVRRTAYAYDSFLLHFTPGESKAAPKPLTKEVKKFSPLPVAPTVPFTLSEDNVLLLDMAEYRFDDGAWQKEEEILRLDNLGRQLLGWPEQRKSIAQPWVISAEAPTHTVSLRFTVESETEVSQVVLALEDAEKARILWNGNPVAADISGWFTDRAIKKLVLGAVHKGKNILEITLPFGVRTNTEWCYLLGDFGVRVNGQCKTLVPLPEALAFSDIVPQGLPFFGANITYHLKATTVGGTLRVRVPRYHGTLVKVSVDGKDAGRILYPPYTLDIAGVSPGSHRVDITLFTHRNNCFGSLHLADARHTWFGPDAWYTEGDKWSYEYNLLPVGLFTAPEISEG